MEKEKFFLPNRIIHLSNGNVISLANSFNNLCLEAKLTVSTYRNKNAFNSRLPDNIYNMNLNEANNYVQTELLLYNL